MPSLLFTPEAAREAGRKSGEARRRKAEAKANGLLSGNTGFSSPASEAEQTDRFVDNTLARVRKQLDMLEHAFEGAIIGTTQTLDRKGHVQIIDPAGIDRISSAIARLSERERQLAGRSLPPTLRANDRRSNRRPGGQPTPQSVVSSVPKAAPVQPASTPPVQPPQG